MSLEVLRLGARALGLSLTSAHLKAFGIYLTELEEWNQRFNLTAITGSEEIQRKHFLDAMSCRSGFVMSALALGSLAWCSRSCCRRSR